MYLKGSIANQRWLNTGLMLVSVLSITWFSF